ncbi:hypothetical protein AJ80_02715 [Polytolypa hystricis UAMH7299]|uniref:Guanine nucleotide-exchange factor SEC12 n=1 Tax=Polytolypa hystricis (strain UAMH7299) TaxID=1447883 RepID=A0A2B7YPF7_POLH7|nr:hypothetical protein AJ80_02715 [Polytolypa hystricis UAMH7299]
MAPNIPSSKITLSCPLFAADFDPRNNGFLLVGGGGGEGRSGVGNKIANTSRRNEITQVVEIELSRDEDSVTSLAIAKADDESIVAFAGINSSQTEQQKNKNEHLRSFRLGYPPRKAVVGGNDNAPEEGETEEKQGPSEKAQAKATTTALSRASLFRPQYTKATGARETYQRVLRLSPWKGENAPRLGAIATGLAPQGEVVLFDAAVSSPTESDVVGRIRLEDSQEADDLDMIPVGDAGNFKFAYTDGVSVYTCNVSSTQRSNAVPQVKTVYTVPFPDYFSSKKKRSKIRALRFLSPGSFVLLQNLPDRKGCELVLISSQGKDAQASITRTRRLPRSMKIGLGLDVCPLSESTSSERQYIIAVSSNDHSLSTFTLDYVPRKGFSNFKPYSTMRDVHPFSMTRIAFSTFTPPAHPVTADVRPQYAKLASVSIGNTAVVHTFPLSPYPSKTREPRYVLVRPGPSELLQTIFSGFMALLVVALGAFLLQAFTEIRGGVPPSLGAKEWLSPRVRNMIARPYIFESGLSSQYQSATSTLSSETGVPTAAKLLSEILGQEGADAQPARIVVQDDVTAVSVETHAPNDDEQQEEEGAETGKGSPARKWEDLHDQEREAWKQKLSDAGHWAAEEGEAIFKGVFFGALAGFVA